MSIPPPPEDTMTEYNPSLLLLVALLGCCHITALAEQVTTLGKLPGMRMITVAANQAQMADADYYGLSGLQKAIRDLPELLPDNPAEIRLCGMFHATLADYLPCGINSDKTIIPPKKHLVISGTDPDKDGIVAVLPDDLDIAYQQYCVLTTRVSMTLKDLTFTAKNIRYVLHVYGGSATNAHIVIDGCMLRHNGSSGLSWKRWPHPRPLGVGLSSGMTFMVKNSTLYSHNLVPITHGSNHRFTKPAYVLYENVAVSAGPAVSDLVYLYSQGSATINTIELKGVSGKGMVRIGEGQWTLSKISEQPACHNEFRLIMRDTPPRPYLYNAKGTALKITSKTTGPGSSVRFDETSSAFHCLIANGEQTDYDYRDGGNALPGYAVGLCSIQENSYSYHKGKVITALGKRLGDCSQNHKALGVTINGKHHDIIFAKNYDGTDPFHPPAYDNAAIIADMNAAIGKVAEVATCNPGSDYYPEFAGLTTKINRDNSEVLAGMGVVFMGPNGFRKARASDGKIDAVVLDNGRAGDPCRIITSGELWAEATGQRFAAKELHAAKRSPGEKLGIASKHPGYFELNTNPPCLEATAENVLHIIPQP